MPPTGMTLSAVSMAYYRFLMPYGLAKFKRYAVNVWDVDPAGETDEELAAEGLKQMDSYMKELGLVMSIRELGSHRGNDRGHSERYICDGRRL